MARCVNCGMEVDVEWKRRGHFFGYDGDYACSDSCERSYKARLMRSADLPHNDDDITFTSKRDGYDP